MAASVDDGTLFEIGSITKVFTGVLLASLVLERTVSLDERLSAHVDDVRVAGDPTLLALATHGSGLPNVPAGFLLRELAFVLGLPRARDPHAGLTRDRFAAAVARTRVRRRKMRYSSLAFGLLGDALASANGRSYEELLRARICESLALEATTTEPHADAVRAAGRSRRGKPRPAFDDRMLVAAGGIHSTVGDMARFVAANLAPAKTPLADALELAQAVRSSPRRIGVGLGWIVVARGERPIHWHNGGTWGCRSFAGFERRRGVGVVALAAEARSVDRRGFRLLERLADLPL